MEYKKIITKPLYFLIAIALLAVLFGAIYLIFGSNSIPVVAAGDTIKVYYTGTLTNGTQFDSDVGGNPLQFTVGSGQVIMGFDRGVIGMKLNETKTITIPANEAYGEINSQLIINVPLAKFGNQTVYVGMHVSEITNGQQLRGIVKAVNATTATIDFNHQLAGQTLIFNIKVVEIQKKQ